MNIKTSKIIITTNCTLPAERSHHFHFSSPFSIFMNWAAIYIPIFSLTFRSAKPCLAGLSAPFAKTTIRPAVSNIAIHTTVLASTVFDSVLVCKKLFSAMLANCLNSCFYHILNISKYKVLVNSKYFDIACKRIEIAYRQPRLFDEPRTKAMPQELPL